MVVLERSSPEEATRELGQSSYASGSSTAGAADAIRTAQMRHRWSLRLGFRQLLILWAAGSAVAASRPLEAPVTAEQNSRSDCQPEQVHLALTGDPSQMRVSWRTDGEGCKGQLHYASIDAAPFRNGQLNQSMPADESTYTADDMCSLPAAGYDFDPPHLHSAIMTDLVPGERYQYWVGQHKPVFECQAALAPGPDGSFSFVVYGDMGEADHKAAKSPGADKTAENVRREVHGNGVDLVLHVGDISYANGVVKIWDTFMRYIEPYASRAPYMIGIGNHEYDYKTGREKAHKHKHHTDASGSEEPYDPDWGNYGNDSGGECGVAVAKRFIMPDREADASENRGPVPSNAPFWYSFEYGAAHFTVISTEHDFHKHSDQRKWLEADLAGVDRCVTPWLFVGMHRPMYVPYPHKSNRIVGRHLQDILEDLFLEREVDLVMTGHVHLYARTCSVRRDHCRKDDDGGITHVTVGCGGHKLSEIEDDQKAWIAEAASHHGYGRVTVESGSSLLWEYVRNKDGRVHDSVRIGNSQLDRRRCNAAGAAVSALLQNQTAGLSQGLAALQAVTAAQSASDNGALVLSAVRDGGRSEELEAVASA